MEYHGLKVESKDGEKTLWAPIVTNEDSLPEHDETLAIGFLDGGVWHLCTVSIKDDDAPEIALVDISSRLVDGYAYRADDTIDVTMNLDAKVDVDETALLALFLGDEHEITWRSSK